METSNETSRGQKTRDALLDAAMEIFGRGGYDAASTRAIAKAAGVNQALIAYHFGGKHGLYLAMFESIMEQMKAHLMPIIAQISDEMGDVSSADPADKSRSLKAIETLLFAMLDILSRPESSTWTRLVMREQQDPTNAFEILYDGFMRHLMGTISDLVAAAQNIDPDSDAARIRGIFLVSQVLIFAMSPAAVQRRMGWKNLDQQRLKFIKQQLTLVLESQFSERESI